MSETVFGQIGETVPSDVDVSWVFDREANEDHNLPIDLALASLLAELGIDG